MPQRLILMLCVAMLTAPVVALQPEEVLVVANANVPESVELAEHYAQGRGIPAENVVSVDTTDAYEAPYEDYDRDIRQPLLAVLKARTDLPPIRCICLIWGVPVRVGAPPAGQGELAALFRTEAERSHSRLAVARQLLLTVGVKFPAPADDNSLGPADLFEPPPPLPSSLLPLTALQKDIEDGLAKKTEAAMAMTDAAHRAIAVRQLMALQMEVNGLGGLIPYVKEIYGDGIDQAGLAVYTEALEQAQETLAELSATPPTAENAAVTIAAMQRIGGTLLVAHYTAEQNRTANPPQKTKPTASVDSELALIWNEGASSGPVANPLHWRTAAAGPGGHAPTMLTARIDGPSAADARNIIDNSLAVEETGLTGKFYVDAGLPKSLRARDAGGGMASFDKNVLREVAQLVRSNTDIEVILDTRPELFPPGSAPDAAMYIGWYSLEEYVPAFTFQQGAVAYHVASYEAMKLRNPNSNQWCPKLIQNGVVATIGAVNEPLLHNFPDHAQFFLLLLTGEFTIVECYWRTIPAASWQMTLIADPLYNPFKANPHIPAAALGGLTPPANWPPVYQRLEVPPPEVEDIFEAPDDADAAPAAKEDTPATDDSEAAPPTEDGQDEPEDAAE